MDQLEKQEKLEQENLKLQNFTDKFESLVQEYGIESYVAVFKNKSEDSQQLVLYRPQDLMAATKILKITHAQFVEQVMINIGEGTRPES